MRELLPIDLRLFPHYKSGSLLPRVHGYLVLAGETDETYSVVAFAALRQQSGTRTRESHAASQTEKAEGRNWPVASIEHDGWSAVRVEVPKDQMQIMRQSMNDKRFTEGEIPV